MEVSNSKINEILSNYSLNLETDLKTRWNNWEKDLTKPEQYEVIGAILARQITIAKHFVSASSMWNPHTAPILLRSLADNYINFAWILESPIERSQKFIYYGLGQEKLQLAHRKNEMENREPEENELLVINSIEYWINSQQYDFLTEVSLKSWSETSVRKMAEEANCIDFYNYVYQPFSVNSHNMWNHIGKYNVNVSKNPFHKFLKTPAILKTNPDFHYVDLACKYTDKMFKLFDIKTKHKTSDKLAYDIYIDDLDKLKVTG
tara:strand:- start:675 stop:1460 length:786 start_codon:yes stop_codon:yes gene_type:complete